MRKEDCFYLGHISRTHGLKGEVVAVFDTDRPEAYTELESVFVDNRGELIPFFIEELSTNSKGHFILRFEDMSPEESEDLVGSELYLPLNLLPPLSGKAFYFHEVIGFTLQDAAAVEIGHCVKMLEGSAQPLFVIEGKNGEEILVPAIDEFIEKIDRQAQTIYLNLPEGLLDLYRNPGQ